MSRLLKASGLRQSIGPPSNSNTPCLHVFECLNVGAKESASQGCQTAARDFLAFGKR